MVAYVLLLISFPLEMTTWLPAGDLATHTLYFSAALQWIFTAQLPADIQLDMLSGATPLDAVKTQLRQGISAITIASQPLFGALGGKGWEWVNFWFLIGGLVLIYRRVISWHIPIAMLASLLILSSITYLIAPEVSGTPWLHLVSGGTMIGAFFIATDPVSGCTTLRGRLVFGAGVGVLTYIIRVWGGYADGIAFAILLMNMLAPTLDYYTQPKPYGHAE